MPNIKVTKDQFGQLYLDNQLCPHALKKNNIAFAWHLVSLKNQAKLWTPCIGYTEPQDSDTAAIAAFCYNQDC